VTVLVESRRCEANSRPAGRQSEASGGGSRSKEARKEEYNVARIS
jgi:hypothetical protein